MLTDFSYLAGRPTLKELQPESLSAQALNNLRAYQLNQRD